jgi:hypothetical protein
MMLPPGMLIHARKDWPCIVCRPPEQTEANSTFLCITCAHRLVSSAVAWLTHGPCGMSDIADALEVLEAQARESESPALN